MNSLGCWDWWGYNNAQNYDTKTGDQMRAIKGKSKISITSKDSLV